MTTLRMPRFVIAVHDVARTAAYYRDVLGFTIVVDDAPGWRFFQRDDFFIMAGECRDAIAPADLGDHSYFAYCGVDDVDGYYAEVVARGGEAIKAPTDEPWGMREFGVRTVDGHRIMFGRRIQTAG